MRIMKHTQSIICLFQSNWRRLCSLILVFFQCLSIGEKRAGTTAVVSWIVFFTIHFQFVLLVQYFTISTQHTLFKELKCESSSVKEKKSKLTQRQANELFMGPNVDMAQRYANTALLLFLTVFYCFPLPIMPALAFFGTVFQYWLEKYLLLRRHRCYINFTPLTRGCEIY